MSAPTGVQLHELNTPRLITLEPACWEANLTALRRQQPALADKLAALEIPSHWQPCLALDDWATWRLETTGQPPQWLSDSALPFQRAAALLLSFDPGELNPSLPGIGTGAELRQLLDRLPAFKAVFVFEAELLHLAAVLRVHDFTAALEAWRLIPIDLATAREDLDRLLAAEPGLLPPGNIVGLPQHTSAQLQRVQAICQPLVQRVLNEREARLKSVLQALPAADDPAGTLLVGFQYSPLVEHAARLWQSAAQGADQPVEIYLLKSPREAHLLALAEQLAAFGPARIICLDHDVERLPPVLRERARAWFLRAESVPAKLSGKALVASPRIAEQLTSSGSEAIDCFWRAPTDLDPADIAADGAIVMLDDLPSLDPATYGVQQPTQRRIFTALLEVLRNAWHNERTAPPIGLLRSAEQLAQLELTDAQMRQRLLELIPRHLLPGVARTLVATEMMASDRTVVGCGEGWQKNSVLKVQVASVALRWLSVTSRPIAAVVSIQPHDPLDPALLVAAARRMPLWLYDPPRSAIADALAERLRREAHYRAISGQASLVAAGDELRKHWDTVTRRAERAQAAMQAIGGMTLISELF